ncbi:hypothetical protein M427DRAFT_54932 [Gonapodya prolifera JEL478]|uniref:Uncharacterized protein n=1 Tax=Gonapodya prolifera (strain JEL478) TaxID=1344416 RepID=A0A139AKG0_GONPJ|nr:hypothetical protein M427DRAFT_54932 [Gonapodya prolifera JEL478]|eukprot:KXS17281.1 hypothetical protein M427DRAFT_54932 [Gonapodya prolifera JEL478]
MEVESHLSAEHRKRIVMDGPYHAFGGDDWMAFFATVYCHHIMRFTETSSLGCAPMYQTWGWT